MQPKGFSYICNQKVSREGPFPHLLKTLKNTKMNYPATTIEKKNASTGKSTKIIYWIFTGLLCLLMLFSALSGFFSREQGVAVFAHLGYPAYLLSFISVAKLLGIVALLVPGFPRLKEWAYAGFTIDITGALYSSICSGDPASAWSMLFIGYIIIFGSYFYYHKKKKQSI